MPFVIAFIVFRFDHLVYLALNTPTLYEWLKLLITYTYLVSGINYAYYCILLLFVCAVYRIFGKRKMVFDKFWMRLSLISFVLIIVTSFLFKNHVSPKHFIYLLPAIAILNIELFNNVTTNPWVRQGLFFVAIIYLAFKSLVLIDIFRKPVDIESSAIASKAIELSASRLPIISCGNCFFYYIKNSRYI